MPRFDPDKREETTLDDAKAALDALHMLDEFPANYDAYGDRFMLQYVYSNRSEQELRSVFGSGFAEQIVDLELGVWQGPVQSGYGTHLVLVNAVALAAQPAFDDIKAQLKEEWMAEQITELSERFIDNLVARYEVEVEEIDMPITSPGSRAAP